MTITTKLYTFFHGHLVGADQFGNQYYRERLAPKGRREKRWVIYKGIPEPSKVPPQWHGWLHYTLDKPPIERTLSTYKWEKAPLPNLTGTPGAYIPPGHLDAHSPRAPATADYQPWKP